jgi:hypothetical protein
MSLGCTNLLSKLVRIATHAALSIDKDLAWAAKVVIPWHLACDFGFEGGPSMADKRDRTRDEPEDNQPNLGNPLGLGGQPITPDASDRIRASDDASSRRRRRARAGMSADADERRTSGMDDLNPNAHGATGVDMGSGGEGTDISDETK